MAGAYAISVSNKLASLVSPKLLTRLAVGGSTMQDQRGYALNPANTSLRKRTMPWWDGSQNGIVTVDSYVDQQQDGIRILGHNHFVVIPPINPYGSTYAGSQQEAIAAEQLARWPNNFLHWNTFLDNVSNAIDGTMFYDPGVDNFHLSELGATQAAQGIYDFLDAKGWLT